MAWFPVDAEVQKAEKGEESVGGGKRMKASLLRGKEVEELRSLLPSIRRAWFPISRSRS